MLTAAAAQRDEVVDAVIRASVSRTSELATQMLAIAEQHGNNELTAQSFLVLALSQMFAGKFESADKSLNRAISMYETMPQDCGGRLATEHKPCLDSRLFGIGHVVPWLPRSRGEKDGQCVRRGTGSGFESC